MHFTTAPTNIKTAYHRCSAVDDGEMRERVNLISVLLQGVKIKTGASEEGGVSSHAVSAPIIRLVPVYREQKTYMQV